MPEEGAEVRKQALGLFFVQNDVIQSVVIKMHSFGCASFLQFGSLQLSPEAAESLQMQGAASERLSRRPTWRKKNSLPVSVERAADKRMLIELSTARDGPVLRSNDCKMSK